MWNENNLTNEQDVIVHSSKITLYPNPVEHVFSIDGLIHAYDITILDINGIVYSDYSNSTDSISIDVQNLPTGMYFILIKRKGFDQIRLKKILKE